MTDSTAAAVTAADNPFFASWATPFELPPFERIEADHFRPAFDRALEKHGAEIAAIASEGSQPTFENTVDAMERSGRDLRQVSAVFFNLAGSHTNDALQAIEREMAPRLARHRSAIFLNEALYGRFATLFEKRDTLDLSAEQARVLDRYHTIFVRAGAQLDPEAKKRLAAVVERLAALGTQFSQNILADEKAYTLVLEGEADLAGLPDFLRDAAAREAEARGMPGKHVITLSRSSIEPFLVFSARRDLREKAFVAWTARGDTGGETDNKAIIAEIVALRAERARLLGYDTFAEYKLADTMAKTPDAALELLHNVWKPAVARAGRERDALQALVAEEGGNFELAPHDWRHYAEKLRKREHELDETEIKPYLQLDRMIEAAFDTAHRLFGLTFAELSDVPRYHPDVRVWEVKREGRHVGLFIGDYFSRPSKRSGAWMSSFRSQEKLSGDIRPIIVNVSNFAKSDPTLLSFDDARTLFHEFGHALHGLLSDVTYPLLAGTSVPTDFVELPSQLYEHWLEEPEVLRRYAIHYRTGEPMPEALLQRVLAARSFNQGFATVEYAASALVDMDLHQLRSAENLDVARFEREALERIGMPREIVMRHRTPHFAHIFSGDGYSAGYYSYLWSEVLDADAFDAFRAAGDIFDRETARKLHDFIYAVGNRRPPDEAYRAFRGRMPSIQALLEKRGLAEAPTDARAIE
jgi:peptidyl-dipeptidase Dcp